MKTAYSQYHSRSQLKDFKYGDCSSCQETIVWGTRTDTLQSIPLNPKPVGGSEINPAYERHLCPKREEE